MSRYCIWTADENLEVFTGFEEGLGTFFLTIADARTCTGESGTYLFHNYDHHPGMGMTLEEVVRVLERFGLEMPSDLLQQLLNDAKSAGIDFNRSMRVPAAESFSRNQVAVVGWQGVF